MLITSAEMLKDKGLQTKLRNWAAQLNLNSKMPGCPTFIPGCPTFKVNGPRMLMARSRRALPAARRAFMGGEEFHLSSIFLDPNKDGVTISAIFLPASLDLAADVSTVTILLSEAIEVFSGFEAWIDVASVEPKPAVPPGAREEALPTVEETRASEVWGAW
jgi:hypothetical protein